MSAQPFRRAFWCIQESMVRATGIILCSIILIYVLVVLNGIGRVPVTDLKSGMVGIRWWRGWRLRTDGAVRVKALVRRACGRRTCQLLCVPSSRSPA